MLVMDVSGSMGDPAVTGGTDTKLDLAKEAALSSLDQFKDTDEVGLRIFSTSLPNATDEEPWLDLVPVGPMSENREQLRSAIENLFPVEGTPLYQVTDGSYAAMKRNYDPSRINAGFARIDPSRLKASAAGPARRCGRQPCAGRGSHGGASGRR